MRKSVIALCSQRLFGFGVPLGSASDEEKGVTPLRSKAQNGRFGKLSENLMKVRVEAKPEDAKSFCGGA